MSLIAQWRPAPEVNLDEVEVHFVEEPTRIFLVRYMEPSEDEHWKGPIRVSVKLAKGSLAGCACHLTDASHMGSEYVPEFNDDGSITLWLMPQSFCFIEK